jgi:hypothetical protein
MKLPAKRKLILIRKCSWRFNVFPAKQFYLFEGLCLSSDAAPIASMTERLTPETMFQAFGWGI